MSYFDQLKEAMNWLAEQENTIFLGQSIVYPGNALYKTLIDIPIHKKIEMPVAEEMQLGVSIGLSLAGKIPVCIFPRMDFMMCCMNQLVNHLDKDIYPAKVIIRTAIGSKSPLYPGSQHCQDYTIAFQQLLKNVSVVKLECAKDIVPSYINALRDNKSSLLIEKADLYYA